MEMGKELKEILNQTAKEHNLEIIAVEVEPE
jgi:REP element-mobilizing transposase RayT